MIFFSHSANFGGSAHFREINVALIVWGSFSEQEQVDLQARNIRLRAADWLFYHFRMSNGKHDCMGRESFTA